MRGEERRLFGTLGIFLGSEQRFVVWSGKAKAKAGRQSPLLYYRTCMGDGKDEISWVEMRYALSGVEGSRNRVGVLEVVWGLMHRYNEMEEFFFSFSCSKPSLGEGGPWRKSIRCLH